MKGYKNREFNHELRKRKRSDIYNRDENIRASEWRHIPKILPERRGCRRDIPWTAYCSRWRGADLSHGHDPECRTRRVDASRRGRVERNRERGAKVDRFAVNRFAVKSLIHPVFSGFVKKNEAHMCPLFDFFSLLHVIHRLSEIAL